MPVRSNEFQKLITLVTRQLAGHASVEESALLTDVVTGKSREVDVLIKTLIAGHETRLCIECIDYKRKADVSWVDEMIQKHRSLPADKLILVSRSGFSDTALQKAQFYNITALTLEAATKEDWLYTIQSIEVSGIRLNIERYELQIANVLDGATVEHPVVFYDPEGKPGNLLKLIETDVVSNIDLNKTLSDLLSKGNQATKLGLEVDVATGKFREWYLIDSRSRKHHIKWVRFYITLKRSEISHKVSYAKYSDANIAFASIDEDLGSIVVFVQQKDGSITADTDFYEKIKMPEDKMLARYYFINGKLLCTINKCK